MLGGDNISAVCRRERRQQAEKKQQTPLVGPCDYRGKLTRDKRRDFAGDVHEDDVGKHGDVQS